MLIVALLSALLLVALMGCLYFYTLNKRISKACNVHEHQTAKLSIENKGLHSEIEGLHSFINRLQNELTHSNSLLTQEIREQVKTQEELIASTRRADEADLLKSNFLANMSHEIRTPMNGILGFAQLLREEDIDDEKRDRYIDIIYHNGTMLVNLIDDIMDISKIEAGQLAINKANCNLDDLMFELYTFFNEVKFKQEKEHISIRLVDFNEDEVNIVQTDGHRLRQIMSNLLSNALKFTEKGTVEFGYQNNLDQNQIKFYVRDSGIGIPKDKRDIIFDQFRQVHEGSTRKYGGTGIGLFISKHIVGLLGGSIWVESEINVGSTFYFTIPYQHKGLLANNVTLYQSSSKKYDWSNKVILVAEDVELNYKLISSALIGTNASIMWARNGEEAVEMCEKNPSINLVLMDIQMPKMDGYDATKAIKRSKPSMPIIAQTAYAMPNDNIKCMEVGCSDYIAKPLNTNILLEKIEKHML
ncbi:MAG: response regulator [Bacteroidales bacterium]|nr:response regulator [Bacteroidales bacterium]MBN2749159.1 response regulator [Bacteroidales bacterium]